MCGPSTWFHRSMPTIITHSNQSQRLLRATLVFADPEHGFISHVQPLRTTNESASSSACWVGFIHHRPPPHPLLAPAARPVPRACPDSSQQKGLTAAETAIKWGNEETAVAIVAIIAAREGTLFWLRQRVHVYAHRILWIVDAVTHLPPLMARCPHG